MPIFRRDPEDPSSAHSPSAAPPERRSHQAAAAEVVTRIAPGTKVVGEIGGSAPVRVEGELHGKIEVEADVAVGTGGHVHGEIEGRSVTIGGRVEGDVRGRERVEVGSSGSLEGDITAPRFTIDEGAFFKGRVEMDSGAEPSRSSGGPSRREPPPRRPATEGGPGGRGGAGGSA